MKVSLRKYIGAIAYPPGSIYCTTKEIDPTTVFGQLARELFFKERCFIW